MSTVHTLVIGAGQAGLALSRLLTDGDVDHVLLERGSVAQRWQERRRWAALRLLSPNWASRLPGWPYRGPDPDGYMSAGELADHLGRYATSFAAPVEDGVTVRSVRTDDDGFRVDTDRGPWSARNVVVATGWCDRPHVPAVASGLTPGIAQLTPDDYVGAAALPDGPVLVVGASATGVQLADELARAGREVILAVGRHNRAVRRYRGLDLWWWLDQLGTFARTIDDIDDPAQAREEGSIQLIGRADHRDVDLPSLEQLGVRLTGRLVTIDSDRLTFADDLAANTAAADAGLAALLDRIDRHSAAHGLDAEVLAPERPAGIRCTTPPRRLGAADIGTVIWATGYRRDYPWLHVPVLDARGEIVHRRGLTPVPGLFVIGQRFQHRRDSNFIDGVGHDAAYLAHHLVSSEVRP